MKYGGTTYNGKLKDLINTKNNYNINASNLEYYENVVQEENKTTETSYYEFYKDETTKVTFDDKKVETEKNNLFSSSETTTTKDININYNYENTSINKYNNKRKEEKEEDNIVNTTKADTKVWSSFYGGTVKHTKDWLGGFNGYHGGLTLDPHDRLVSYDDDWNMYVKGEASQKPVYNDDGNIKVKVKPSKDATIVEVDGKSYVEDKSGRLISVDGEMMKDGKIILYDENGRAIDGGEFLKPKNASRYQMETETLEEGDKAYGKKSKAVGIRNWVTDRTPDFIKKGGQKVQAWDKGIVDGWLKSKFGDTVDSINKKIGNTEENVVGSNNQYRVGQNWRYGSVGIYNNGKVVEGSVVGVDFSTEGKYGEVYGRADLLYGKATANFELGPDHVELSASAEASILHAEIKGQTKALEDDNGYLKLAANGSVSADVAKAYANGKIGAGYYKGADGKMHLDAGIQGSVGADLCSATAKGNVDLGPIGVGGQATVKIGIGAQANIGFEDGKFNLHLGVALGVGVELGVSVDVSRATKAVVDTGKAISSKGKEVVKDIGTAAKKTYNNVKSGAKKAMSWLNPFD